MKRKLIDEKGRIFGAVSLLDILAVLVAAALAAAVYIRFFSEGRVTGGGEEDKFTYVLRLEGVRQETIDALRVGDKLYDAENSTCIGTLSAKNTEEARDFYQTLDGQIVERPVPDRYDLCLTVEASGIVSGGVCYAARTLEILENATLYYKTKYIGGYGRVVSVTPEEAQ